MTPKYKNSQDISKFCKNFSNDLISVGIFSISTHELQLRVVELLLNIREDINDTTYFEKSNEFMIPESKLKKNLL